MIRIQLYLPSLLEPYGLSLAPLSRNGRQILRSEPNERSIHWYDHQILAFDLRGFGIGPMIRIQLYPSSLLEVPRLYMSPLSRNGRQIGFEPNERSIHRYSHQTL